MESVHFYQAETVHFSLAVTIADVLIYTLTLAHDLVIDNEPAILNKIEKNALKYPR